MTVGECAAEMASGCPDVWEGRRRRDTQKKIPNKALLTRRLGGIKKNRARPLGGEKTERLFLLMKVVHSVMVDDTG